MPDIRELKVSVGDRVSIPVHDLHKPSIPNAPSRVIKTIVGPVNLDTATSGGMVLLVPPNNDSLQGFVYDSRSNVFRYADIQNPMKQGEIRVDSIHNRYTLFERA